MVKHFAICDQGSSHYREDGLIITQRTFGVLDGVSTPYSPKHPPKMFDSLSGGEMVVRFCEKWFNSFYRGDRDENNDYLESAIKTLSRTTQHLQIRHGLTVENSKDAGLLTGATFAFVHILTEQIEIVQAGDLALRVHDRRAGLTDLEEFMVDVGKQNMIGFGAAQSHKLGTQQVQT